MIIINIKQFHLPFVWYTKQNVDRVHTFINNNNNTRKNNNNNDSNNNNNNR